MVVDSSTLDLVNESIDKSFCYEYGFGFSDLLVQSFKLRLLSEAPTDQELSDMVYSLSEAEEILKNYAKRLCFRLRQFRG